MGIFDRRGAPVERELLRALTRFVSYRGPDACEVWCDTSIGFGHTLLRTTRESLGERQPASLDGKLWITADARLDSRGALETELEAEGRKIRRALPDCDLILHAYAAWGENCVLHLRGDFAFAIWDARQQLVFCARDHLGIKPFYYAEVGELFLFSNTLDCLRLHPGVSETLNETAVADFLLFGLNCDAAATTFRDICRLPGAHCVSVAKDGLRLRRYWTAPTNGRIRYRRADDYIEHFQSLLHAAVADRLHPSRTGIFLSGGLDSGAVAATARELTVGRPEAALQAYTAFYESPGTDTDGAYARMAADFLGIPIHCQTLDGQRPFDRWDDPALASPEPVDDPFLAGLFDQFRLLAAADCQVVLSGEGADNLMHFEMWPHVADLAHRREWFRLALDTTRYLRARPIWPGVRRRAKAFFRKDRAPELPRWLSPGLAGRTDALARWRQFSRLSGPFDHPLLPKGHASLSIPQWSLLFELEDPGVTRCPVEVRYPFLDLRVVDYLLALPPFPWFFEKHLVREALAGRLPEKVRVRPKTPIQGDPLAESLRQPEAAWLERMPWAEELGQYVDVSALEPLESQRKSEEAAARLRPICFNFWLQSLRRVRYNLHVEVGNG